MHRNNWFLKIGWLAFCLMTLVTIAGAQIQWVASGEVKDNDTFKTGMENGKAIPVCKCMHLGNTYPGKVISNQCIISWDGIEVKKSRFEVLLKTTKMEFTWVELRNSGLPAGAVTGGRENEKFLYVGRVKGENGNFYPGKIFKSATGYVCEYILDGKVKLTQDNFEILVANHVRR
ncbi:MAG: DUF3421 domain-containing protein [Saprospiraceae bacterium]|nr:DUF3421 domain-containing protein [Saprospiraceae bacterium]